MGMEINLMGMMECSKSLGSATTNSDLAMEFSAATEKGNFELLTNLLADNGEFTIQSSDLETLIVGKDEFLDWFRLKLAETEITSVEYDRCSHCCFGNRVVLFNGGKFPRTIKDNSERSRTGIMVDTRDGQIITLKFCYIFLESENPYVFECDIAEAIKDDQELRIASRNDDPF